MPKKVLIPLPSHNFDPTETAIPWRLLRSAGIQITFATPSGSFGTCDQYILRGIGLGPLAGLLSAEKNARIAYREMSDSTEFRQPIKWNEIEPAKFDGLILPG